MNIKYDKEVRSISGPGWRVGKSRVIVADGVGYVFTTADAVARTFDAATFSLQRRRGKADGVSWNEWCGCGGRSIVAPALKAVRAADLVALAVGE